MRFGACSCRILLGDFPITVIRRFMQVHKLRAMSTGKKIQFTKAWDKILPSAIRTLNR